MDEGMTAIAEEQAKPAIETQQPEIETDEPESDAGYGPPESAEELNQVAGRRLKQIRRARQLNNPSRERLPSES